MKRRFKCGLKLFSINTDTYWYEAKKLFDKEVYDYIELYYVPGTLDTVSAWKKLQIPYIIHHAHSGHGVNLADNRKRETNRMIFEETQRVADTLDAPYIIFHGGIGGFVEETINQLASFRECRTIIENKPRLPLSGSAKGDSCRGATPQEIALIMKEVQCGFCLDFCHAFCAANSLKQEPYSYIETFCSLNPKVYHLSDMLDMSSEKDTHLHLGKGCLDISRLLTHVSSESYLTIETEKDYSHKLDDFIEDMTCLTTII